MATAKKRKVEEEVVGTFFSVRVSEDHARMFTEKCVAYGGKSAVLRECIEAFNEGRLSIKQSPKKKDIYSLGK